MAALVGFVQESWNTAGQATLAWPAGTAANHLAVAEASHSDARQPLPDGWTYAGDAIYWRMLTAADIIAPSSMNGIACRISPAAPVPIRTSGTGNPRDSSIAEAAIRNATSGVPIIRNR